MTIRSIEGFSILADCPSAGDTIVVAEGARDTVLAAGLDEPARVSAGRAVLGWTSGGRAPHPLVAIGDELWVVKSYRRGGWLARWNRELYLGCRRFYREMEVYARARRRGVPTVQSIALVIKRGRLGLCRAWLVSCYCEGSTPLSELLGRGATCGPEVDRRALAVCRAAGRAVRRMHEAGIDHRDLNLANLLVTREGDQVLILDWDRATIRTGGARRFAFKNLLRLYRSALKLQGHSTRLAPCLRSFLRGYFQRERGGPGRLRRYYRRRRFTGIHLHRLFWS